MKKGAEFKIELVNNKRERDGVIVSFNINKLKSKSKAYSDKRYKVKTQYRGNFFDNKYHGYGEMTDFQRKVLYEGNFENGVRCGTGRLYQMVNKSKKFIIYEGQFENDLFEGSGILYFPPGNDKGIERIEGAFSKGKANGDAKCFYKNGDVSAGTFIASELNGIGKYIFNNGNVYEGYFVESIRHGEGKCFYKDQDSDIFYRVYVGVWENNVPVRGEVFDLEKSLSFKPRIPTLSLRIKPPGQ